MGASRLMKCLGQAARGLVGLVPKWSGCADGLHHPTTGPLLRRRLRRPRPTDRKGTAPLASRRPRASRGRTDGRPHRARRRRVRPAARRASSPRGVPHRYVAADQSAATSAHPPRTATRGWSTTTSTPPSVTSRSVACSPTSSTASTTRAERGSIAPAQTRLDHPYNGTSGTPWLGSA